MSTMVRQRAVPSNEFRTEYFGGSPLVRAQRVRSSAARLCRKLLTRPAKQYEPLISPQELSDLRHRGGCVAKVKLLMIAAPEHAMEIAESIHAHARIVSGAEVRCLITALRDAQRADSAEDISRSDVLIDQSPENLRRHIADLDEAIARAQAARDAIARRLEDLESKP